MERLEIKDIINNAKDDLNRARDILYDVIIANPDKYNNSLTEEELLLDDMASSIERLDDLMDRIEFALILANYMGWKERDNEMEMALACVSTDDAGWREQYLHAASQIDFEYENGCVSSEWAYNEAADITNDFLNEALRYIN